MYHIAGKFGGNCIWRNGLQVAKNKYWWNLIWRLEIAHTDFYYVIMCSYPVFGCLFGSPHVVRLKCKDRVEVMEDFQLEIVFDAITECVDSIVEGSIAV